MNSEQPPLVETVFYHLVLPPKLPRKFDGDNAELAVNLGKRLHEALPALRNVGNPAVWDALDASLRATRALDQGFLGGDNLLEGLRTVVESEAPVWLALHITQQNAALLIHRDASGEKIIFESFQVSAPVRDVLNATHALTWDFPGRAVSVPLNIFNDASFQENLSDFLDQSSTEVFDQFAARATKGGQSVVEARDCPNPALVNDMLMSLLEGLGNPTTVRQIRKRVRDDVVLDSSDIPWRRSPYWLILRVTAARLLSAMLEDTNEGIGRVYYKFLICVVLANLLGESVQSLHPEMTLILQAKLCRRLAKLESEKNAVSGRLRLAYEDLFSATRAFFEGTVERTKREVVAQWENYKASIVRQIPLLPGRAPRDDLSLRLPNSGPILLDLLSKRSMDPGCGVRLDIPSLQEGTISQVNELTAQYMALIHHDDNFIVPLKDPSRDSELACIEFSTSINNYLTKGESAYRDDPLLMSRYLLRLFELWVKMDRAAIHSCPLLKDYHPVFVPHALDVLCLMTMEEMERLAHVQQYIAARVNAHTKHGETIFSNPRNESAFAHDFVYETTAGESMVELIEEIEEASERSRESKESELEDLTEQYRTLTQEIQNVSCTCTRLPGGKVDSKGCQRCKKRRARKALKIMIHEDFLPSNETCDDDDAHCAAIVYELRIPKYLAAYRQATWNLYVLGSPAALTQSPNPVLVLDQVEKLRDFTLKAKRFTYRRPANKRSVGKYSITLASRKKLFSQTHWRKMKLPKQPHEVILPFGAEFSYYDGSSGLWADELPETPWFQHLLGPWLPEGVPDPYENCYQSKDKVYHPTSSDIIANEIDCPRDMSVHEFSAYQRVVSGRGRRWLAILTELSSTNINFSSEITTTLFTRLALQAGPAVLERGALREAHIIFHDQSFCETLHGRLSSWLASLESNCREVHCMGTIVTLSLRLYHLCLPGFREKALNLLARIRHITSNWIVQLRHEVRVTPEGETARKSSDYAFRAALLCRQTFSIYADCQGPHATLGSDDMQCFFQASIALQEHLLVSVDELSLSLKNLLVQDLCTCYRMRAMIKSWVENNPHCLESAINETWSDAGGLEKRVYSQWTLLSKTHHGWATARVEGTKWTAPQVIHYHIIQGHLTVDGKPLGRLPLEMREDAAIKELFGGQHLLTRPSNLLEHQLVNEVDGHQVHFGSRGGKVIIRAIFRGSLLEHVPRTVFKGVSGYDLPSGLVDDCVHWLNLDTGKVEMRRKPRIWFPKPSNWILDVHNRQAVRGVGRRKHGAPSSGTYLVEPRSEVGQKIYHIFQGFEDAERLTIYQPSGAGPLSVEMKRLEIRFFVNTKGLLQCQQLRAEVDPQQDVGTLYGLYSQIQLRGIANPDKKSVLVPIGSIRWERRGIHVAVGLANEGLYAKFTVDQLLGRLDCPPEPLLLYLKAALHALTSFPLPDGLTGRTGTEEARHCLVAARSQPWAPLQRSSREYLSVIRSLSPSRWLYPPGLNVYQKVRWDSYLTMSIQHEGLAPLVDSIALRSADLETFAPTAPTPETEEEFEFGCDDDAIKRLCLRGRIRRQIYERVCFPEDSQALQAATPTVHYSPISLTKQSRQAFQTTRALQEPTPGVSRFSELTPVVQQWETIGGFDKATVGVDIRAILDLNMPELWGSFVRACLSKVSNSAGAYDEHFQLALLAFDSETDMNVVSWLVALSKNPALRAFQPPKRPECEDFNSFDPSKPLAFTGFHVFEAPSEETLTTLVLNKQPAYEDWLENMAEDDTSEDDTSEDDTSEDYTSEDDTSEEENAELNSEQYYALQAEEAAKIASLIVHEGPGVLLSTQEFEKLAQELSIECINLEIAWENIQPELQRLSYNLELSVYLLQVDEAAKEIRQHQTPAVSERHDKIWSCKPATLTSLKPSQGNGVFSVPHLSSGLMKKDFHFNHATRDQATIDQLSRSFTNRNLRKDDKAPKAFSLVPQEMTTLSRIFKRFTASPEITRQQYGNDLETSLEALINDRKVIKKPKRTHFPGGLNQAIAQAYQVLHDHVSAIRASLSDGEAGFQWLDASNLWPCLSPVMLLEQLRHSNKSHLSPKMRTELLLYGVLFTKVQRLVRMRDAELSRDEKRLREEQEHEGHSNWSPLEHPEWLLLEIDNNILIRPPQVDVARAIIWPASESNSVLQMNMGQGKTSCVIPMAVAMLADKTQLCRLMVPRALLHQTAQVLQSRIGGLVGRQVCHIPFARRSPTSAEAMDRYQDLHRDIRASGGVMLCLPEHILSFKLSGIQKMADAQHKQAKRMIEIQRWLDTSSRDILDESDFTLSAKTQLIYPSGIPTAIDGHPQRWRVVEDLLALVESHVSQLQSSFKDGIDVRRRHRGYPIIHFLRTEVEDSLNALLVQDICEGRLPQVQLKDPTNQPAQENIGMIVSGADVSPATWEDTASSLTDDVFGWKMLHLLRGLISQRVLLLCLKKRWNVQYGLHPNRSPIAVPFEAKGVPSETAEYGHPDTALVLTCLAFYQTGLSKVQVAKNLQHIMKSDDPAAHYERLVHSCNLPASLQQWNLLDMEDEMQMDELWQLLRFDRNVLNYFLNNFAFPQHAKQFSVKLQASGWDIPLLSKEPSSKNLTTGFSGTNDNKRILPHTIKQDDLPSLVQTNAEVLSYLLEPRNQRFYQAADSAGKHLTETGLLELLRKGGIKILIDAGAHILEMENHDLASAWLEIFPEAQGAVYFDHEGRIMVRARFQKAAVPLLASPFADNLENCVVYIDEAHTRGTDLKLPVSAKAAVTLGLGQTKDQTVQAAMRLRQLGSTQSVAFVAPPEVYQSILRLRSVYNGIFTKHLPVTSEDVVHWLLEQSCAASENIMSLHLAQGFDFCRRTNALWKDIDRIHMKGPRKRLVRTMQLREDQTLEQLYGARQPDLAESSQLDFQRLIDVRKNLHQQRLQHSRSGKMAHSSAFEEVEQEREVEFEVEQVREKQKPTRFTPYAFESLDSQLVSFVQSGQVHDQRFERAFGLIARTSIGRRFGVQKTSCRLLVSKQFAFSIQDEARDDIVRPVEWILWSSRTDTAVLVTSEEAELLLPIIRKVEKPWVRLIAYAAPVAKSMQVFNTLQYLTIPADQDPLPAWVSIEVGIIAGRLYFEYHEYEPLLAWLGVAKASNSEDAVRQGLFIHYPLKFLLEWLTYRRQTADILHTPMGYVCQGRALHATHTFFNSTANLREVEDISSGLNRLQIVNGNLGDGNASEDDSEWEEADGGVGVLGVTDAVDAEEEL
ncbi:hypothetical protein CEP52_013761 [Fusarium oligoseptatum]|uniref:ubiquitinyl hydrolase 1 n=1 Tax=Fusarium oligoseptatum TaxID=2604345 RepID=A0A428SRW8_9HYPO|nr:hypothetical protein CEP52_013761 [Fusarium oligoseptatum]